MSGMDSGVVNGKSVASMERELPEKWPTVKEMESVLNCIHCKSTTSYPFMQCAEGHLICEDEGQQLKSCPCGATFFRLRLRWFKWMTKRASYACPVKDCTDAIVGQKDEGNHILLSHESEELFAKNVSPNNRKQAEDSSDESEEESLAEMFQLKKKGGHLKNKKTVTFDKVTTASSSEFMQPKESRPRSDWTTPTAAVKIRGFSTVLQGRDCEAVLEDRDDYRYPDRTPMFSEKTVRYSDPEQYHSDRFEMMRNTDNYQHDQFVEEHGGANYEPRRQIGDNKVDKWQGVDDNSVENASRYGVELEEEPGESFRLSTEDEKLYYMHKGDFDRNPEHWSTIIRRGRMEIPLSAICREFAIIRERANRGKQYKRDRRFPSPVYREEFDFQKWLES